MTPLKYFYCGLNPSSVTPSHVEQLNKHNVAHSSHTCYVMGEGRERPASSLEERLSLHEMETYTATLLIHILNIKQNVLLGVSDAEINQSLMSDMFYCKKIFLWVNCSQLKWHIFVVFFGTYPYLFIIIQYENTQVVQLCCNLDILALKKKKKE